MARTGLVSRSWTAIRTFSPPGVRLAARKVTCPARCPGATFSGFPASAGSGRVSPSADGAGFPPTVTGSRPSSPGVGPGLRRGTRRCWAARPALPAAPTSLCLDLTAPRSRRLGAPVRTRAGRRGSCSAMAAVVSLSSAIVRGRAASSRRTPVVSSVHIAGSSFVWTTHGSLPAGDNRERGGRARRSPNARL